MDVQPDDLADANLVEALRAHARWQAPCTLADDGGVLRMAGANDFPGVFRNCALRVDAAVPAAELLARVRDFFAPRRRGYTLLARAGRDADLIAALQAEGLRAMAESPCMRIEAPVGAAVVPAGVRIEPVRDLHQVQDVAAVCAQAYEALRLPAAETRLYFSRPQALLVPQVIGFVAYRDAVPQATALTLLSGASAGLYWVGTVPQASRQGLGELCTRLATNAGFAAGARVVTLQASPFGAPLYERLGYRRYDRLLWFRYPPP